MTKVTNSLELKISDSGEEDGTGLVAYIYMPGHSKEPVYGLVKKQIRLLDLIDDYEGPDLYLDFGSDNKLLGIEVLG